MWSNDLSSIIFTRIKVIATKQLQEKYPNIYFTTSARVQTNPKFPTVVVRLLSGSEVGKTFDKTVNGVNAIVQIDVIDNKQQRNADVVADVIMGIMRDMDFTITGTPYTDESDTTTYRNIARYSRVIGHGDTL